MPTILLIEDEPAIADNVLYALRTEGIDAEWVQVGAEGVARVRERVIDLVILDVGLPDGSGFEFCKEIRTFSTVPVIFLTARGDEIDRVVGLEIGADDYIVKPFSPRELTARVRVILRRVRSPEAPTPDTHEGFVLDRARQRVSYLGVALTLTRFEFLILTLLMESPERVYSRRQIMEHVWEQPDMSQERAVDTHIKALRNKLREVQTDADPIQTHRGVGYSLEERVREV